MVLEKCSLTTLYTERMTVNNQGGENCSQDRTAKQTSKAGSNEKIPCFHKDVMNSIVIFAFMHPVICHENKMLPCVLVHL